MKILVVDDEKQVGKLFEEVLQGSGADVEYERSGFGAMVRVAEQHYDLIFMDIVMPGVNGVQAIEQIRDLQPGAQIIVITGKASEEVVSEAIDKGAASCLHRPFGATDIWDAVKQVQDAMAA